MPDPDGQASAVETTEKKKHPGRPAEELAQYAFTSETASIAGKKGAEAKRRKREEMAAGPREALALGLMDELQALRAGTRLLVQDYASDSATVRKGARRELAVVLNQALGGIEQRKPTADTTSEGTLPTDREARMRLLAEVEARLNEGEAS